METTNNTQYNSLGEMAKAGDYPLLLEKLQQYEGTDDMKILTSLDDRPYSELEELLFRMSRFALKPQKKEDNEETLLNDILINDVQNNKKELYAGFVEVVDIILFVLSCRYLNSIPQEERETMQFLSSQLNHIEPIRILFGGPKE